MPILAKHIQLMKNNLFLHSLQKNFFIAQMLEIELSNCYQLISINWISLQVGAPVLNEDYRLRSKTRQLKFAVPKNLLAT